MTDTLVKLITFLYIITFFLTYYFGAIIIASPILTINYLGINTYHSIIIN